MQPKRAKAPTKGKGGKATTSVKGKGPMKKVTSVASTSATQQDWDIPEEEELSSTVEESSEDEVDAGESSVSTRPK